MEQRKRFVFRHDLHEDTASFRPANERSLLLNKQRTGLNSYYTEQPVDHGQHIPREQHTHTIRGTEGNIPSTTWNWDCGHTPRLRLTYGTNKSLEYVSVSLWLIPGYTFSSASFRLYVVKHGGETCKASLWWIPWDCTANCCIFSYEKQITPKTIL